MQGFITCCRLTVAPDWLWTYDDRLGTSSLAPPRGSYGIVQQQAQAEGEEWCLPGHLQSLDAVVLLLTLDTSSSSASSSNSSKDPFPPDVTAKALSLCPGTYLSPVVCVAGAVWMCW